MPVRSVTFVKVVHQFSLFDYSIMRPKIKVPLKRISKERYDEALKQIRKGNDKGLLNLLRDVNDSLDVYMKRHKI